MNPALIWALAVILTLGVAWDVLFDRGLDGLFGGLVGWWFIVVMESFKRAEA